MTPSNDLQALLDRETIRDVVLRVCRAMDRADHPLFLSFFHDDAWDDHGYYKGPVSEFRPGSIFRAPHVKSLMHNITTHLVDLDGDVAWSEAYYIAIQRADQDGRVCDTVFGGRYHDRLERRDGVWKIADRLTIFDWTRVDEVRETLDIPGAVIGSASVDDPSYTRLANRG
jgi:hypothetical protein